MNEQGIEPQQQAQQQEEYRVGRYLVDPFTDEDRRCIAAAVAKSFPDRGGAEEFFYQELAALDERDLLHGTDTRQQK